MVHGTPEGSTQGGQNKMEANKLKKKIKNKTTTTVESVNLLMCYLASIIYH